MTVTPASIRHLLAFALVAILGLLPYTSYAQDAATPGEEWVKQISAKVRSNLAVSAKLPQGIKVSFDVELLPDGGVASVIRRSSSGYPIYDEAAERAIFKSSPFGRPANPNDFVRRLSLVFSP